MHPPRDATQVNAAFMASRMGASLLLLVFACWGLLTVARRVPGFVRHLGQSCETCDLAVFEPPLKPYIARSSPSSGPSIEPGPFPATVKPRPEPRLGPTASTWFAPGLVAAMDPLSLTGIARWRWDESPGAGPVSYTHLTLPTILRV